MRSLRQTYLRVRQASVFPLEALQGVVEGRELEAEVVEEDD